MSTHDDNDRSSSDGSDLEDWFDGRIYRAEPVGFSGWPNVPRVLPQSRFAGALDNSSLSRQQLPPRRHTRPRMLAVEEAARQRRELRAEARQAGRRDEDDQADEDDARVIANESSDELHKHYRTFEATEAGFKRALSIYESQDMVAHDAFAKHILNAHIVSPTEVRRCDIMRWYTKVPDYVLKAVNGLGQYHHTEVRLRYELKDYEKRAGSWGGEEMHPQDLYAAIRYDKGEYGFESSTQRGESIEMYEPRFTGRQQLKHLIASFEVRKVRLEQAEGVSRFPNKPWERSLDLSVLKFIDKAEKRVEQGIEGVAFDDQLLLDLGVALGEYSAAVLERKRVLQSLQEKLKDKTMVYVMFADEMAEKERVRGQAVLGDGEHLAQMELDIKALEAEIEKVSGFPTGNGLGES